MQQHEREAIERRCQRFDELQRRLLDIDQLRAQLAGAERKPTVRLRVTNEHELMGGIELDDSALKWPLDELLHRERKKIVAELEAL